MTSGFVFDGLRMHLRARGLTYAHVARALKISEATVKRIFATRNCTLDRLDSSRSTWRSWREAHRARAGCSAG